MVNLCWSAIPGVEEMAARMFATSALRINMVAWLLSAVSAADNDMLPSARTDMAETANAIINRFLFIVSGISFGIID